MGYDHVNKLFGVVTQTVGKTEVSLTGTPTMTRRQFLNRDFIIRHWNLLGTLFDYRQ